MIKLLEAHPPKHPSPLAQTLDSSSGLRCSGSLLATSPLDFPARSLTINFSAAMRQGHFIPRACVGWLGLPLMKCHSLHDFTPGIYFLKQSWWLKGASRDDFWWDLSPWLVDGHFLHVSSHAFLCACRDQVSSSVSSFFFNDTPTMDHILFKCD